MSTDLSHCRLFQLISPSLPIGGYTYSQGVEWAVDAAWIKDQEDLRSWVEGLLETTMLYLELPVMLRMMRAWQIGDSQTVKHWNQMLLANRETRELREEEVNRGRALYRLLASLESAATDHQSVIEPTQHAGFSFACVTWGISESQAAQGFAWSWMENIVMSAIKIIPLGQTAGQQLLHQLSGKLSFCVEQSLSISDDDIGCSSMAMAIASAAHERQYSRLFRS